jgi:SulP family sulfate permease
MREYGPRALLHDSVAGLSVALVLIPQSLAYAELAGMPAHTGLYAAAAPPIAAALFAASPHLQTGPTAMTGLLTLGALSALAAPGDPVYVRLASLLALVVGAIRLAVGLLRWGAVAHLLSQTVLTGFTSGAALLIVASQLPVVVGASPPLDGVLASALWVAVRPGAWQWPAILLSGLTVLLVVGGRRVNPLFPGVLLAVALGAAFSLVMHYEGAVVGEAPAGLPSFSLELPWDQLPALALPGFVIALAGFAEPAAIARAYSVADHRPWKADREFLSQGAANLASGASGGFPVGGSFSRSALDRASGARTRWSSAITGLAVLMFLPFAGILSPLPSAVLGAIVLTSVLGLLQLRTIAWLWRLSKPQFWIAVVTLALTLLLSPHVERAVLLGTLLAVIIHLWRELPLDVREWEEEGTLHLRPIGVLWFGSAYTAEERFQQALDRHREAGRVIVHLNGLGRMDLPGALTIGRFLDDAREAGLETELADVPPQIERLVETVPGLKAR